MRSGDASAFECLYLSYHDVLWKFAYGYVRSSAVAEELVQDVFFALWRDRAEWDVHASVRAWLYAAVRYHAMNHRRHERVVARLRERVVENAAGPIASGAAVGSEGPIAMGAPPVDAQTALETQELGSALARAVAALPERRRVAMTLRWKHGLTASEIARVLGGTPESVRVLLTRARQQLADVLDLAERE